MVRDSLLKVALAVAALAGWAGCKGRSETVAPGPVTVAGPASADESSAKVSDAEIIAASGLPPTITAPLPNDPMKVTIHRLSNGLTVYVSTDRQQPRFVGWIGVRAGSRMDPPDSTGLAHYLEHMLFKGTDDYGTLDAAKEAPHVERIRQLYLELRQIQDDTRRKAIFAEIDRETQAVAQYAVPNELDRIYSSLGIEGINAFTSNEQTVYIGDIPANRLEAWASVESERFADPVFRLFYTELEAVYEEKNLSLDNPWNRVWEATYRSVFPQHPYGLQTTIGEVEHLKTPAYEDMTAFFERWYVPNNMAIVLAGDVDAATAVPLLERQFARLQPKPLTEPHPGTVVPISSRVVTEVQAEGEEELWLSWLTVPGDHPDEPVLAVMDRLLDDARVGLLNVELELTQKVPSAGSWNDHLNEGGYFGVRATARVGQSLGEIEQLVLGVLAKLKAGEFAESDVDAIKLQHTLQKKRELENNWARAARMMDAFVSKQEWSDVVARDEAFQRVTKADVVRVANKYLGDAYAVVQKRRGKPDVPKLEKPSITAVKIDPKRKSTFAQRIETMVVPELEPEWVEEGVHYRHEKLAAGDLIATKNERNDLFSLTYYFDRGYRKAPLLCYALELFELSGSGTTPAEAVQKQLYALGSRVSTDCDAEHSSITIEGVDVKLEQSLAVLDAWLADPTFAPDATEKLFDNTVSGRRNLMEQDWSLTSALDSYSKFGTQSAWLKHPSNKSLRRAKPAELRRLITQVMGYEHRTLYFGPRDAKAAATVVARKGKFKPTGEVWTRKYRPIKQPTIYFLHKDGAKANVRFVLPRKALPREQRPVAELLSEYLSGNMSALVFQEIREARGLAYSAYSVYSAGTRPKDASGLLGYLSTQADKTPEAVETFLGLLRSSTIDTVRLDAARKSLDQEYRSTRIDPRWVNWWVVEWDERGEPRDPRPEEWAAIKTAGAGTVEAFAQDFESTPAIIGIVGDRERVGLDALRKLGQVVEVKPGELFSYGEFPATPDEASPPEGGGEAPSTPLQP